MSNHSVEVKWIYKKSCFSIKGAGNKTMFSPTADDRNNRFVGNQGAGSLIRICLNKLTEWKIHTLLQKTLKIVEYLIVEKKLHSPNPIKENFNHKCAICEENNSRCKKKKSKVFCYRNTYTVYILNMANKQTCSTLI